MNNTITSILNKLEGAIALFIISSLLITSSYLPVYAQEPGNGESPNQGNTGTTNDSPGTDQDSASEIETPGGLWVDETGVLWVGDKQAPWTDDEGVAEQYIPVTIDADDIEEEKQQQLEEEEEKRLAEAEEERKREQRDREEETDGGNEKPYAMGEILFQYDKSLFKARTNELANEEVEVPGGLLDNTNSAPAPVGVADEFLKANGVANPLVKKRIESMSVELVTVGEDVDPLTIIEQLKASSIEGIVLAQPNFIYQSRQSSGSNQESSGGTNSSSPPDDTELYKSWHLKAIQLKDAWDVVNGNTHANARTVTIGIIDTGVDFKNEDLDGRKWSATNCKNENGGTVTDNDDTTPNDCDKGGYNLAGDPADHTNNPKPATADDAHGTEVASVAAAEYNNGYGVIGVAQDGVEIVGVRITASGREEVYTTEILEATNFARHNNLDVINISSGVIVRNIDSCDKFKFKSEVTPPHTNKTTRWLEYQALQQYQGVVTIAAENRKERRGGHNNEIDFPADFSSAVSIDGTQCWSGLGNVISVTGTRLNESAGTEEANTDYAYGNNISITAPAKRIPVGKGIVDSGNSYAAPQVAGVAALMLRIDPTLSSSTIKTKIINSADTIQDLVDNDFANGKRLNAYRAVKSVLPTLAGRVTLPLSPLPKIVINTNPLTTSRKTITVPNLSDLRISSKSVTTSNSNSGFAKTGDTLTLTFTVSETLASTPTVTLAGSVATVATNGNTYTATTAITDSILNTVVTYDIGTLTDSDGNTHNPEPTIVTGIDIDTTAPVVTITGSNSVTVRTGNTYREEGATAKTGETVVITGTVNTAVAGTYTITYTATDAAGNIGTATRTVTVSSAGPTIADVDSDDDGLIDIKTLTELYNIRHNLAGTAYSTSSSDSGVSTGCPSAGCKGYELMNNLNFAGSTWASGEGWDPIGTGSNEFTGIFDGNEYAIANLFINQPSDDDLGLFAAIDDGAIVRNLVLTDVNIAGDDDIGAIAGEADGSSTRVENVFISGTISGDGEVAGVVGDVSDITVKKAASYVTITGDYDVGGIVGDGREVTLQNSYFIGTATGTRTDDVGGLFGYARDGAITNSYTSATIQDEDGAMAEGLIGYAPSSSLPTITNTYYNRDASSSSYGGTGKRATELQSGTPSSSIFTGWSTSIWDFGTTSEYPTLGLEVGTPNGPSATVTPTLTTIDSDADGLIDIKTLEHLNNMRYNLEGTSYKTSSSDTGKTTGCPSGNCTGYELMNDLNFAGSKWVRGDGWEPVGDRSNPFEANFDGNGYEIEDLFIDRDTTDYVGLFGRIDGKYDIENIVFDNPDITGDDRVGVLAGLIEDGVDVENITVKYGDVEGDDYIGGLAGEIEDIGTDIIGPVLIYRMNITGDYYVGGLAGNVEQAIIARVGIEDVDITGDDNIGGLIGRGEGSVTLDTYVSDSDIDKLDSREDEVAGMIGDSESDSLLRVYTSIDIEDSDEEQGIIGQWARASEKPAIVLSYYDSDKTTSHTFISVRGKTTRELKRGVGTSPVSANMNTIYNGWETDTWDFRTTSRLPRLKALDY